MEIQSTAHEVYSCQIDLENNTSSCTGGEGGACLAWEDLTAMLPNFGAGPTRRLINGLTGYALPGRIMAVMGPSGSGKSTFLDSLTGRLSGNVVMTGNVLLNGKKKKLDFADLAYVTQQDEFLGTLTVRETISYSALLRLPNNTTTDEIKQTVENAILEMGLQECADNLIGNWHLRGISGGEKKRLSIALEILTQPRILFLDEPTTGLDSASAFFVIQALRNIASSAKTIISSIHQPSSQVFEIFDDLLLLSNGQTIYFGETKKALKFFADAGFPCPSRRNPADHFLRCINSDFDNVNNTLMGSQRFKNKNETSIPNTTLATSEIRARLLHFNQKSKCTASVRARVLELSTSEGILLKRTSGKQASWWKQLTTLTRRSFKNMTRDFGYYWLRIIVFITVSICVGSIFYDVGSNYNAILARGSCAGFISGFMTFMTIGGFPSFIEEMKIFHKERLKGHYGVGVFILSNFISSFPFLITMSFSSSPITYFMVKFHPGIVHFIYATLTLLVCIAIIDGCMMVVAAIVPNFLMGVIVGSGFIGIMMASAGFFQPLPQLPKIFWTYPVSYINYMSWALQGGLKNDLIGIEFEPLNPGQPKLKGEEVITSMFGFSLHHSKWWDLVVIFGILIAYRLLFFFILKFKERVMPICRTLYAKITIHHMKQRPSFRLTPPFPSKRHQLTFSLSSQEGLNSPLH